MNRLQQSFNLARAVTASYLQYALAGTPHPFSASFAVTNRCNLHCSYCSCPSLDRSHMPLEQMDLLFKKLAGMGVRRLGLLGGEPMVRNDLPEILTLAQRHGMYASVNTNLLLHARNPETLRQADFVFTSLDGRPETHIRNRGAQDYDSILQAIRDLRSANKPVVAITVVTPENIQDIPWLLDQADELDCMMHFQPQCFDTEIVRGEPGGVAEPAYRQIWTQLQDYKAQGRRVISSRMYLQAIAAWHDYMRSAVLLPDQRCAAGRGYLFIDPNGNAWPCAYTKGKMEPVNLLTHDWQNSFDGKTPCTDCIVGPMLEFNQLFRHPLAAVASLRSYQKLT